MRRFACMALALMALLAVTACTTNDDNSYRDSYSHNGYPGPATRSENR